MAMKVKTPGWVLLVVMLERVYVCMLEDECTEAEPEPVVGDFGCHGYGGLFILLSASV
jgi:hypothetical protein